jgi:hypothetical protein
MIEKKIIGLSVTDVRDAILSHVLRTTDRAVDGTVYINGYPLIPDYAGSGCPEVIVVYDQKDLTGPLRQGQLVNVRDPKDFGRNPFSVRFGKKGADGIIVYSLADAMMDPASRGYTQDELEVLVGEMAVGMTLEPSLDSHISESKSNPLSKDAVLRIWEEALTEGVTNALDRHYRFKIVPADPDTRDTISPERHEVIVNSMRLATWRTQQMHDMYVNDRSGEVVNQIVRTFVNLITQQKAINSATLEFSYGGLE